MAKVNLLSMMGETIGEIELNDNVFGIEVNRNVLHEYVKNYLANQRQGTQSAKTRAEVRGGGRKPFKQKGTGNARQGSIRAPHFIGGGVVFAPKPRDYRYSIPKKVKRLALMSALSSKLESGQMIVVDNLNLDAPKTKDMIKVLENLKVDSKALIVTGDINQNIVVSARNIEGVATSFVGQLNPYEILKSRTFIITKDAVQKLEEVYA